MSSPGLSPNFARSVAVVAALWFCAERCFAGQHPSSLEIVTPGPYWTGQSIEMRVQPGSRTQTSASPILRVDGAQVYAGIDQDGLTFIVVPTRPGRMTIAAENVPSADSSIRRAIDVASPPNSGRNATFLGGTGTATAAARIENDRPVVGTWVVYELILQGPAALGSIQTPMLRSTKRDALSLDIEQLPGEVNPAARSRTFRFRVRAPEAGRWVIGPTPVSTYHPEFRRFETIQAPSVALNAIPRATVDQSAVRYAPATAPDLRGWYVACGLALIACASWLGMSRWRRWKDRSKRSDLSTALAETRRGLQAIALTVTPTQAAESIETLLGALVRAIDPASPRTLTPGEAAAAWLKIGAANNTAHLAGALAERCSRFRCSESGRSSAALEETAALVSDAIALLDAVDANALGAVQSAVSELPPRDVLQSSR